MNLHPPSSPSLRLQRARKDRVGSQRRGGMLLTTEAMVTDELQVV